MSIFIQLLMLRKLLFTVTLFLVFYFYAKRHGHLLCLEKLIEQSNDNFAILKQIDILGNHLVSKHIILKIVDIKIGQKLYSFSVNKIRAQLLKLNEIKGVEVSINYSGILSIIIYECKPFAIWWNKNHPLLIDYEGNKILEIKNLDEYKNLIIIFGQNFHDQLKHFIDLIKIPFLYTKIKSLHYIGNRRWDVYTNDNIVIKLPEDNIAVAVAKSKKILTNYNYHDRVNIIDLRLYPKRLYLRLKNKV